MKQDVELAKLTLRLLLNDPAGLQEVLEDLRSALAGHIAAAGAGEAPSENERRARLLNDFVRTNGMPVLKADPASRDISSLERELAGRLQGLPSGASIRLG